MPCAVALLLQLYDWRWHFKWDKIHFSSIMHTVIQVGSIFYFAHHRPHHAPARMRSSSLIPPCAEQIFSTNWLRYAFRTREFWDTFEIFGLIPNAVATNQSQWNSRSPSPPLTRLLLVLRHCLKSFKHFHNISLCLLNAKLRPSMCVDMDKLNGQRTDHLKLSQFRCISLPHTHTDTCTRLCTGGQLCLRQPNSFTSVDRLQTRNSGEMVMVNAGTFTNRI